ncbi:MAG: ATP-binding protein [Candidatus Liptonbacteria bacterium]|nr:ATP-binding protein [Candidatus Liptonbacteria bacterium]
MNFKKITEVILWPEMRMVWVLVALLVAVLALSVSSLTPTLLLFEGLLFIAISFIVFFAVLRAALAMRGNLIEKEEFKNVIFNLDDGLIVYDKDFRVILFNPAAEKIFMLDAKMATGHQFQPQDVEKPMWRLTTQVVFPSLAPSVVNRSAAGTYPQIVDLSFTDPQLELRVTTSPVGDPSGGVAGFMKIIHNRTRETSLVKSKNEFLTVASHQLRSPVTDINWALETLSGDPAMSAGNKDILDHALTASRELLKIIEDLLNIAKIEEGRFGYVFENEDLLAFLNGLLAQVVPLARRLSVKVYFDRPKEPLPQVMIDSQKLALAVNNLLVNSVRYNIENGEVVVKAEKLENKPFIQVSIKDTGIGIPQEALPNLFKKFFRSENALKFNTEGSGLGLYIAKNVIQGHGGAVWAESETGRGSTFYFTIPTDPNLVPKHEVATEE